jgi:hypothetical protein
MEAVKKSDSQTIEQAINLRYYNVLESILGYKKSFPYKEYLPEGSLVLPTTILPIMKWSSVSFAE